KDLGERMVQQDRDNNHDNDDSKKSFGVIGRARTKETDRFERNQYIKKHYEQIQCPG
ncbi:MAG: hypothetical protein JWP88_1704, partial [Flaviaesturariibacter sp.]|nr:hypothetical protein [Flaviaesturariibacter sp.]